MTTAVEERSGAKKHSGLAQPRRRRRLWNARLLGGCFILAIFALLGFVVSFFAPVDPTLFNTYLTGLPPSPAHLLGTTDLGQDTFWLLAASIRNSVIIGLAVAAISTAVGVFVGLWAGYQGGSIDRALTLLADAVIVIPSLPILILISSMLQGKASLFMISLVLSAFNWPWPARQARSLALSLREREFINTAKFSGETSLKIILVEIAPHVRTWAVGNFVNTVLVAIGAEAGLALIGLSSMQRATLGTMIYWALNHQALLRGLWIWIGAPVASLVVLFYGLIMLSTGLARSSKLRRGVQ